MPLTAVVWNIEQFGIGKAGLGKDYENLRCGLVAAVINNMNADVVVIQEMRSDGTALLAQLKKLLTGEWHFDWLPGAQVTAGDLDRFELLGFVQSANNEGYGVLWKKGALDALPGSQMSAGIDTLEPRRSSKRKLEHYVELASNGKPLKFNKPEVAPIIFDSALASQAIGFPRSICMQAVNSGDTPRRLRSGNTYGDDDIPQQLGSRRPCSVQMHVSGTRSVPLVVYHAPVGQKSSRSPIYGTLIGCAVDQLQGADCVYAGDFNVFLDIQQSLLNQYLPTLKYGPITFTPSMVHVFNYNGSFRTGTGIYGSARDFACFKAPGGSAPTVSIRKVTEVDIKDKGSVIWSYLTASATTRFLKGTIVPAFLATKAWSAAEAAVFQAWLADPGTLPPGSDAYTAAAIVYTSFLSDHLPIVIKYA